MTKLVQLALAILLVILAWVSVFQMLREPEPVYQRKSASYWMNYDYRAPNAEPQFCEAWRSLGSNAIPFLIQALDRTDPQSPMTYSALVRTLPLPLRNILPTPSPPANVVRSRAASALGLIGNASRPAIPPLLRTMDLDEDEFVRNVASNAFKAIDPEAAARAGVK